jgi:hypothetical protein
MKAKSSFFVFLHTGDYLAVAPFKPAVFRCGG